MLTVETIRKIRIASSKGKSIRRISRELNVSRNTIRKVLRSGTTEFEYERKVQHRPQLGPYVEKLEEYLEVDWKLPRKQRRTAQVLFEELQAEGYSGAYDSVRRYVKRWRGKQEALSTPVYIPLSFGPGEAFQFDWSHEWVELSGVVVKVKVAHIRLLYSRMFLVVAYMREQQEMVFDAHIRGFDFFDGACQRGIYDNMKTAVKKILLGKERDFTKRFSQLCSHYLFEPVACTPGAGWEKGQVENQVGTVRKRFFTPRPKYKDMVQLNGGLVSQCLAWAKSRNHPQIPGKTVWEVYQEERPYLVPVSHPFDGYAERDARVSPFSLVTYDRNRYSVKCSEVGKTVQVRAYADRIVIVSRGKEVGRHIRYFGRNKTIFNPWHYLQALERKPGALRNGAPFSDWDLPRPLEDIRAALERYPDSDRQFVAILKAVPLYGLEAVAEACEQALTERTPSKDVVLNILYRSQDNGEDPYLETPPHLQLKQEPATDCARYDTLLKEVCNVSP